jgi:hypothetical protein
MATRIVAARTRYEPQARCGTNSSTSIKNANKQTRKSMNRKINRIRRYLVECDGPCKCDTAAMMVMTSVISAATGCTIRIAESVLRTPDGRSKA